MHQFADDTFKTQDCCSNYSGNAAHICDHLCLRNNTKWALFSHSVAFLNALRRRFFLRLCTFCDAVAALCSARLSLIWSLLICFWYSVINFSSCVNEASCYKYEVLFSGSIRSVVKSLKQEDLNKQSCLPPTVRLKAQCWHIMKNFQL